VIRKIEFRQVGVWLAWMEPVLDFDGMRRQRGSGAALTAPGLLGQTKRSE